MRRLQWVILDLNSNKGSLVDGLPDFQVPAYDDDHLHVKTFHLKKALKIFLRAFHLSTEEMKRRRFRRGFLRLELGMPPRIAQIFWKRLIWLGPELDCWGPYGIFYCSEYVYVYIYILYTYTVYIYIHTHSFSPQPNSPEICFEPFQFIEVFVLQVENLRMKWLGRH